MKQLLLIIVLLPLIVSAQEVRPVLSPDYQSLIDSAASRKPVASLTDSTNDMNKAPYRNNSPLLSNVLQINIRRINTNKDGSITFKPVQEKTLSFGTVVTINAALLQHTRLPAVQSEYAQGRSEGGVLKWRGAETGEWLSFGPSLGNLSFDGSSYIYDQKGRLITGNGVNAYDNSILQKGSSLSQSLTIHARLQKQYSRFLVASLRTGQNQQRLILQNNRNKASNISLFFNGQHDRFMFNGHYNFRQTLFSNSNRNGMLNRAWQSSLLTPASFSNSQGTHLASGIQRSYSAMADNPLFLLQEDGFRFRQRQQTAFLSGSYRYNKLQFALSQTVEVLQQRSNESWQPGTAGFLPGISLLRNTHDKNYSINARINYGPFVFGNKLRGRIMANHVYINNRSAIEYNRNAARYDYQRSAHDISVSFSPEYNTRIGSDSYLESGATIIGKMYASNTSLEDKVLAPSVSGYFKIDRLFNFYQVGTRVYAGYSRFNSEMSLNRSIGYTNLLQYTVAEAKEYYPVEEIQGFDNLVPARHKELTAGIEIFYSNKVTISFNWFNRRTANDFFPVNHSNGIKLVNMGSHRNRGFEAELSLLNSLNKSKIGYNTILSISKARTIVTDLASGYDKTPIAGFSDVYKALVKGQPLGVIMGNTWMRDAFGNRIIGSDGFPLVNNTPQVIGDPNPDFIIKLSQKVTYKNKLTLVIEPEWRKGGDIWNGTRAVLDYHGRSAASSSQRNRTGHLFDGVLQNGSHNNIPVSFYDPLLPVEQNRWVRYGMAGVAEDYIEKGDCIRINNISLNYKPKLKKKGAVLTLGVYVSNIILWSSYQGVDPSSLLMDEPALTGLDFFNTPGVRSAGFTATFQL